MDNENNNKSYKTTLNPKIFYTYIFLIFIFVLVYSINFLVTQYIEKQGVLDEIADNYIKHNGNFEGDMKAAQDYALSVFKAWSLPVYLGGLSTVLIFFVFVMFGRTKVAYGYFFRTAWLIIFVGSGIFMFFNVSVPLWQQIVNFILVMALAAATLVDLLKVNRNRENLKLEIRNEWANTRNNKNLKEKGGNNG